MKIWKVRPTPRNLVFWVTMLAATTLVALTGTATASHSGGPDAMSIDMDPASSPANTATALGTWQSCARINEDNIINADEDSIDTLNVDITTTNIPVTNRLQAFQYFLNYSAANLTVSSAAHNFLIEASGGTATNFSDSIPDTDGSFAAAVIDLTPFYESGSGVLSRLGLSSNTGATSGVYALTLTPDSFEDAGDGSEIFDEFALSQSPDTIHNATVAINAPCGGFTAQTTVTLSSTATSAAADTTLTYSVASGDYYNGAVVYMTPQAANVKPGPGHASAPAFNGATDPAVGDIIGTATFTLDLGLASGACSVPLTMVFPLLNATVDNSGGNLVAPVAVASAGSFGALESMWTDNGDAPSASPPPGAVAPVNGIPADVERYPSYLNTLLTPDGGSAVQPLARYTGNILLSGLVVSTNIVVFSPGALAAFPAPNPAHDLGDASIGYAVAAFVHIADVTQAPQPTSLTDVCSPRTDTTFLRGTSLLNTCSGVIAFPCNTPSGINAPAAGAANKTRYTNPSSAASYLWVNFHQSQRDLDGDGYENALDTCPYTANLDASPRSATGPDGDMIDSACDPTPVANTGAGNHDADTGGISGGSWLNAGDNCPLVVNGTQADSEIGTAYVAAAPRGGPNLDFIGDACDTAEAGAQCTAPNAVDDDADGLVNDGCVAVGPAETGCLNSADDDADGTVNDGCPSSSVVANGKFETRLSVVPKCIGGTDGDSDGWCNAALAGQPADPNDGNAAITPEAYSIFIPMPIAHSGSGAAPPQRQPVQVCNDGIDNDGDTFIDTLDNGRRSAAANVTNCNPVNLSPTDTDGDGFSDEAEINIGTDALGRCEVGGTSAKSTDWPLDFSGGNDRELISDILPLVAPTYHLYTNPGDAGFDPRFDLVPGFQAPFSTWINLTDLGAMRFGATGNPAMFSGAAAFGHSPCTAHPTYGD